MEKEVIRHIIEDLEISSGESQKERFFFLLNAKKGLDHPYTLGNKKVHRL